jgi:hypothetical protein
MGHLFFQRDSSGPNFGVTTHEKWLDDFDDENQWRVGILV